MACGRGCGRGGRDELCRNGDGWPRPWPWPWHEAGAAVLPAAGAHGAAALWGDPQGAGQGSAAMRPPGAGRRARLIRPVRCNGGCVFDLLWGYRTGCRQGPGQVTQCVTSCVAGILGGMLFYVAHRSKSGKREEREPEPDTNELKSVEDTAALPWRVMWVGVGYERKTRWSDASSHLSGVPRTGLAGTTHLSLRQMLSISCRRCTGRQGRNTKKGKMLVLRQQFWSALVTADGGLIPRLLPYWTIIEGCMPYSAGRFVGLLTMLPVCGFSNICDGSPPVWSQRNVWRHARFFASGACDVLYLGRRSKPGR